MVVVVAAAATASVTQGLLGLQSMSQNKSYASTFVVAVFYCCVVWIFHLTKACLDCVNGGMLWNSPNACPIF
jgi:hypothetical protein